jgi:hypothetical protein
LGHPCHPSRTAIDELRANKWDNGCHRAQSLINKCER